MIIKIEPSQKDVDRITKQLDSSLSQADSALKKAINATAKEAKKDLVKQTRQAYTIKRTEFKDRDVKVKKATKRRAGAVLSVKGEQIPIKTGYQSRKNSGKSAAKAKIIKGGSLKGLIKQGEAPSGADLKAFSATMSNGHDGIFMRATSKEQNSSKSKTPNRLIKQLHSLAAPEAAGNKKVWTIFRPTVNEKLTRQLYKFASETIGGS